MKTKSATSPTSTERVFVPFRMTGAGPVTTERATYTTVTTPAILANYTTPTEPPTFRKTTPHLTTVPAPHTSPSTTAILAQVHREAAAIPTTAIPTTG